MAGKAQEQGKMRKKIFHNGVLKIGSLVLAYLFWLLVIQFDDPAENKTFRGIPVTLTNTELLDQQDKVYAVLDGTDSITVTVRAPRSVIKDLDMSDIVAVADMSKLTEINTIAISLSVQNADNVDNIRANPDVLRLNVEDRLSKWINVSSNIVGEVAEEHMVSSVRTDQNRIEVTGPASAVSQISKAMVEIDVTGAVTDVSANVEAQLLDADGNLLDLPTVSKSVNNVHIEVEVLATKEVPVVLNYTGEPADNYLLTGEVRCEPATVLLAGEAADLNDVNRLVIPAEDLDITDADDDVTKTINIRKLLAESNVRFADSSFDGNVSATVFIEQEMERTLEFAPEEIQILNLPEDMEVEYPETEGLYQLSFSGLAADVNAVLKEALNPRVDLAAWMAEQEMETLGPGEYQIPVTFDLPDSVVVENDVMLQINIVQVEEE